jgi:hypothetical protein
MSSVVTTVLILFGSLLPGAEHDYCSTVACTQRLTTLLAARRPYPPGVSQTCCCELSIYTILAVTAAARQHFMLNSSDVLLPPWYGCKLQTLLTLCHAGCAVFAGHVSLHLLDAHQERLKIVGEGPERCTGSRRVWWQHNWQ